jgi:hypothetical protein
MLNIKYIKGLYRLLLYIVLICTAFRAQAQITLGPGIVNRYYPVTAIVAGGASCTPASSPTFTLGASFGSGPVVTATALTEGNKVLVIQMRAGSSGSTNSGNSYKFRSPNTNLGACTYGDVLLAGNSGNYEFAIISTVSGSDITFTKPLLNTYNIDGQIQVIPVAGYSAVGTAVNTSGIITPLAYDSTNGVGGVVAIESNGGILTLNGNINAQKLGFKGGPKRTDHGYSRCCTNDGGGAGSKLPTTMKYTCFYNETTGSTTTCADDTKELTYGAPKGSGIFGVISGQGLGYAHIGNGAGGGSAHNSGGGGGGGASGGGNGGYEYVGCSDAIGDDQGGRGGVGLAGSGTKVYMGGGGGCGLGNETSPGPQHTPGGHGGGIIILKAAQIAVPAATNITIDARGESALTASIIGGAADGAGGGGGGGTILIELTTGWSLTGTLTINASGGDGGDNNSGNCHGTGGGGGGGRVEVSASNANLTLTAIAGTAGTHTQISSCGTGNTWGAAAGGTVPTVSTGVTLNQNNCTLSVTFLSFYGEQINNNVDLFWSTAVETNSRFFEVERSYDASNFITIGKIDAAGNSANIRSYSYTDYGIVESAQKIYYRIKEVDIDSTVTYTKIIFISFEGDALHISHSNPVSDKKLVLTIKYLSSIHEGGNMKILLFDALGKKVLEEKHFIHIGANEIVMDIENLSKGFYILRGVKEGVNAVTSKLIIE